MEEEDSGTVGAPPSVRSPGVNGSTFPPRCPASWGLSIGAKCGRQSSPTATPSTADRLQKHGAAEYLHSPADMPRRSDTQTLVEETLDPLAARGFPPVLLQDPNVLSP